MSQNTSQKDLADSQPDNPLQFIRSQKLREFFTRKPSYLRSVTPDASYSTMPDFQKSNPLSIEQLGLDQVDFLLSQKITPNTHRPSMQKDLKEGHNVRQPHHKMTRSRSSHELEQMIENVQSKDLLTEVNYAKNHGNNNMRFQNTSKKDDKTNFKDNEGNKGISVPQSLRGRTKNKELDINTNNREHTQKEKLENEKRVQMNKERNIEDLNQSLKKGNIDDSMNKDNSIGNIIEMMGPSPNHRNLDDFDLMNKESGPLSSVPSDEMFGVQHFFPGDMRDVIGSGSKTDNLGNSPPTNSRTPHKEAHQNRYEPIKYNKGETGPKNGLIDEKASHDHLGSTQATGLIDVNTPNKQMNLQGSKQLGPRQMTFDLVPTSANFNPSSSNRASDRERNSNNQLAEGMRNAHSIQNQEMNARFSSSLGSKGESLGQNGICRFHQSNAISYICIKDNCGELLCPLCLYEHQKTKHVGEYEAIPSFVSDAKQKLGQVRENFLGTIQQIVGLQSTLSDRTKFDLQIVEEIDRVESILLKSVKQFFDNVREEYSKEIFFDFPKVSDDLNLLHYDLNSAIKSLEEDLQAITKDTPNLNPYLLTHIVQKGYVNSSINYKRSLNDIDHRVRQFIKTGSNSRTAKLNLELNPNLKSKFVALLTENIRFNGSNSTRTGRINSNDDYYTKSLRIPERGSEQNESLTNTENIGRSLQDVEERKERFETETGRLKTSESQNKDSSRPRSVSPWKGHPGSQFGTINANNLTNTTNTGQNSQRGPKTYFVNKKLTDTITNRVLEMYQAGGHSQPAPKSIGDKDVELSGMRFLIEYLERFYGTSKIKILDPSFFQRLLGADDVLDFSDFGRRDLFFEGVFEDLQSDKGRCVFTSYEKVFIMGRIQNSQWILIEVRSNPKVIIMYDFLGKLNKTKFSENVFGLVLEIIRKEYNSKLGQNPENYLWERKVASQPILLVKNAWDTGILALKVISNCYQNKDFSSGKITLNEITLTRKKLEKIFKMYEEKKNHDKFVPI